VVCSIRPLVFGKIQLIDCNYSATIAQHVGHDTELSRRVVASLQERATAITSRVMHGNGDDPIDDFPLGDGTADTDAIVVCPYCGEENEIAVDPGSGDSQDYIEDCQVCCRPWRVSVSYDGTGAVHVVVEAADDA